MFNDTFVVNSVLFLLKSLKTDIFAALALVAT